MESRDLYQEMILDHSRSPRNKGSMDVATAHAEGYNAMCGDSVHVWLRLEDSRIIDVTFDGVGCAICLASASMMTMTIKGESVEDVHETVHSFIQLLTSESTDGLVDKRLGKLMAFSGVAQFPARVKCATLAWRALQKALAAVD